MKKKIKVEVGPYSFKLYYDALEIIDWDNTTIVIPLDVLENIIRVLKKARDIINLDVFFGD